MKTPIRFLVLALLTFSTAGCVIIDGEYAGHDWRDEQRDNREAISQLQLGTSRDAVLTRLGPPRDSEAFLREGEEVRVLFYRTRRTHSDGETTRDETTPLVFEGDKLVGWGADVYAAYR